MTKTARNSTQHATLKDIFETATQNICTSNDLLLQETSLLILLELLNYGPLKGLACYHLGNYAANNGDTELAQYYWVHGRLNAPECLLELAKHYLAQGPLHRNSTPLIIDTENLDFGVGLLQLAERNFRSADDQPALAAIQNMKTCYSISKHTCNLSSAALKKLGSLAGEDATLTPTSARVRMTQLIERPRLEHTAEALSKIRVALFDYQSSK